MVVVFLGLLCAFALGNRETVLIGMIGLGVLIVGIALLARKSYIVRIGSASGEADALQNTDRAHIQKVVDAVSQAIIDRR